MSRSRYGKLKEQLLPLVQAGASNLEIRSALPHLDPNVVVSRAAQLRKKLGIRSPAPPGEALRLPRYVLDQLKIEAYARDIRNGNGYEIARQILEIVVRDDLFDAILGEVK